jgi:putative membrane protein
MTNRRINILSWALLAVFTVVTLLRSLAPNVLPSLLSVALVTLLPLAFVFVHGSLHYRFRELLVFAAITLVVSNIFENLSILTGFPFGHYYYTDGLGPKLFLVPILIGPAYLGTGYLAWTLARILLGATDKRLPGHEVWAVPVLASFLMVAWDLSFDPLASTIGHSWIWLQGGNYFGVPFSNYLGWFLTVFVFFQLFALYLRRRPSASSAAQTLSRSYWLQAVAFYGVIASGIPLNILTQTATATVADAAGVLWRTQDIYVVCDLVCLFTMVAFTIIGLIRLADWPAAAAVRNVEQRSEAQGLAAARGR